MSKEYKLISFNLSEGQLKKALSALKNNTPISFRVAHSDIGKGHSQLAITERQMKSLHKKHTNGLGGVVKVTHHALKHSIMHGKGLLRDWASKAVSYAGHKLVDYATDKVKGKGIEYPTQTHSQIASDMFSNKYGKGVKKVKKHKVGGKGFIGNLLGTAVKYGTNALGNVIGGTGGDVVKGIGNVTGSVISGFGVNCQCQHAKHCTANGIYACGY